VHSRQNVHSYEQMYASPYSARPVPQRSQDFRISRATAAIVEAWPTGLGVSTMREELARAYAFMARGDMGGSRTVDSPYGRAVYTDEVPKRSDCNYLWVECEAKPEELVAEAQRLERRLIFVPDPELGARLAPWFAEHGWRTDRHLVMAQLREPERAADLSLASELDEEACDRRGGGCSRPALGDGGHRAALPGESLIGTRDDAASSRRLGRGVIHRSLHRGRAQIEDVSTLPSTEAAARQRSSWATIETARFRSGLRLPRRDAEDWQRAVPSPRLRRARHYTKLFMPPA
jgi:hypothetical protein